MKKRLILVTGAAGFIGSHLVDALVAKGESVRCFVRAQDDLQFLPTDKVEIIYGDLTDKKSLIPAVKDVDVIYHLAAKVDFAGSWEDYHRPNVLGMKNLVDLAIKEKVKRFIFFSTIRVVGLTDSQKPIKEDAPYNPLLFYDQSKYEGEKILREAFAKYKLPYVVIRPTSVYGPRDRGTYYSFFKAIADRRFILVGKGDNLVSFVFVKNIVEAAVLVMENNQAVGQTYFVNDKECYTMKKLSTSIANSFGLKLPRVYLPKILGYLAGYTLLGVSKILPIKPILTPERIKNLTISYVFSIEKAKKDLGYKAKYDLKQGVSETAKWYKEHGWI